MFCSFNAQPSFCNTQHCLLVPSLVVRLIAHGMPAAQMNNFIYFEKDAGCLI